MTTYTLTTIDPPGSVYTLAYALNDSGQIAGYYEDSSQHWHGFVYGDSTYTLIDVPNSIYTAPDAINAAGEITGWYPDSSSSHLISLPRRHLHDD